MLPFRFNKFIYYILEILPYLRITFTYVFISLGIGVVFGLLLAIVKIKNKNILKVFANGYTTVMRSIPSIVLLFLVYYGVPFLLRGLFHVEISNMNKIIFIILTLGLFSSASLSEVMRSAYQSVHKGQMEAGLSIGLSGFQVFKRIIFPQAFRVSLPNLGNQIIFLIHEGALAYTIGLKDIMGKAFLINSTSQGKYLLEVYFGLALIYWLVSIGVEQGIWRLDRLFSYAHIEEQDRINRDSNRKRGM